MSYRTSRAIRFGGRRYADGDPIPHPDHADDDGITARFDTARQELLDMGAIVSIADPNDGDEVEQLLRRLAELKGVDERLLVVVAPSSDGVYRLAVDGGGVVDIQPMLGGDFAKSASQEDLLAELRDLSDCTVLLFDDDAAAQLGGIVLLSADPDTGIVTDVQPRDASALPRDPESDPTLSGRAVKSLSAMQASDMSSASTPGVAVADAPQAGAGEGEQIAPGVNADGGETPPIAAPPVPADDAALAAMSKAQLLAEGKRVRAVIEASMSKAELVKAIVARREAA